MSKNIYRDTTLERALNRAIDKLDVKLTPEQITLLSITMGQNIAQYITTNGDALGQTKNNSEATMLVKQLPVNRLDSNGIRTMIGVDTLTTSGSPDTVSPPPPVTTNHVQFTLVDLNFLFVKTL